MKKSFPTLMVSFLFLMSACSPQKDVAEMKNVKSETKIYYIYDAICGWCYGFSPVMGKIYEDYKNRFDFEIVSGGLKLGESVGPINEIAPYIKAGAYLSVEQTTGVKFGEAFINGPLEDGSMVLNSLPPGIALSIVKDKAPEKAFEFGSILHKAFYFDGHHPEDIEKYGDYAKMIGLDAREFIADMSLQKYKDLADQDFSLSSNWGISAFPTLVGVQKDSAFIISQGYAGYDEVAGILDRL